MTKTIFAGPLFLAAAALGLAAPAQATPWQTNEYGFPGSFGVVYVAMQQSDNPAGYELGYECDNNYFEDLIYVKMAEPFDPSTSYAPEVPTTFWIDGRAIEMSGRFENSEGILYASYYAIWSEAFSSLITQIAEARSEIRVTFFDKDLTFSSTGAADALRYADGNCRGAYF